MSSPKPLGMLNGEVEKKKNTKQQEQELCNSFYPVSRHFSILPYPVTGFISGNFFSESLRTLTNPKEYEVP